MHINELSKGQEIVDFFLIKESSIKEATNGKYLDLVLIDSTGSITGKFWRCNPELVGDLKRGVLAKVKAKVDEYRGLLQLNIQQIRAAQPADEVDTKDFIKRAPLAGEIMYEQLKETINRITNENIRSIVDARVEEVKEKLLYYPAAKSVHHSFFGGLLYHTNSMVAIGEALYPLYPFLDKDLLMAGIILHDLDKTEEMIADEFGVETYSLKGILLGHLVTGVSNIERIGLSLGVDEETRLLLEHLVLSHHHKAEYGSPVPPLLPEGELLHFIDNIDAKMNQLANVYETVEPGEFSEKYLL